MITYGRSIEWRDHIGFQRISVQGHATGEEAFADALAGAIRSGWTPPEWWHFWRWNDVFWKWDKDEQEAARAAVL
jgi:hypothetical protein